MSRTGLWMIEALAGAPPAERLRALRAEPILLALGRARAGTAEGQLMLATAASLLGRLFDYAPAIDVAVDPAVEVLPGIADLRAGRGLAAEVIRLLGSLSDRPAGRRYRVGAHAPRYAAALVIGDERPPVDAGEVVYVDAAEWVARLGATPPAGAAPAGPRTPAGGAGARPAAGASRGANPFGALVAAALGAAEITKGIVRRLADPGAPALPPPVPAALAWDLWSHRFAADGADVAARAPGPPLDGVDLGRVAVAGVGAVGSAALYALLHVDGARGTLELVDDDELSVTNLERVLLARAADVGRPKVQVAARAVRRTGLLAVPITGRYEVRAPARAHAGTILTGVDSGGARRRIMNLLPDAVYNGGTQGAELLVSRHVGLAGPCLECLYPEIPESEAPAPDAAPAECGRAALVEELPEATISFVAGLCGFLVALELVKDRLAPARGADGLPLDAARPVQRVDLLGAPPSAASVEAYVPRRECFCQHPTTRRRYEERRRA